MTDRDDRPLSAFGVIGEPMTGVSYVRFVQPFGHLSARYGHRLNTLGRELDLRPVPGRPEVYAPDPAILDGADLLIFPQAVASPTLAGGARADLVGPLCDVAAKRGIPIVYSVDDHLELIESHNPSHDKIRDSLAGVRTLLDRADALFVTTEPLREALRTPDRPIHLLPNAVDPPRFAPRPRNGGTPRVGWAGSASHIDDLLMLAPAVRRLQRRLDCRLVLLGLTDLPFDEQARQIRRLRRAGLSPSQRDTAERFMELLGELRDVAYDHVPFVPVERYFPLLSELDLDIGVCPLRDTPFNRHKSALKFYEYAMVGTMTVASRVAPYESEVSVTVPDDATDWAETLERFLNHGADREAELRTQRDYVLHHRTIERLSHRWHAALSDVAGVPWPKDTEVA